jgi:hypothetical protein
LVFWLQRTERTGVLVVRLLPIFTRLVVEWNWSVATVHGPKTPTGIERARGDAP